MTTPSSKSTYPVLSGQPPSVPSTVSMVVNAAGNAQAAGVAGADKLVLQGIITPGSVIFGSPPTAGLTSTAIAALTTTQIAALTSNVILTDITVATLTTTAISALTPGDYYDTPIALTVTQLTALSTSTITALTTTQVSALTAAEILGQIAAISGAYVKPDLPITTMLSVVPASGQAVTAAVRSK